MNLEGKELIDKYKEFRFDILKMSVALKEHHKETNNFYIDVDNKLIKLYTMLGSLINEEVKKIGEPVSFE